MENRQPTKNDNFYTPFWTTKDWPLDHAPFTAPPRCQERTPGQVTYFITAFRAQSVVEEVFYVVPSSKLTVCELENHTFLVNHL